MHVLARYRLRKRLRHLVREARHVRALREDVAAPADLARLDAARQAARDARRRGDAACQAATGEALATAIAALVPPRRWSWLRENIEVAAVALAVAMAFRTYIVQPFKIPTSSMAPSLFGIHYQPQPRPDICDRILPLRLAKWALLGAWYEDIRARAAGQVRVVSLPEGRLFVVGGIAHRIPDGMTEHVAEGEPVMPGQLLASGRRLAGDHIFVNKIAWQVRAPRRGEIMVFTTRGIHHPQIKTNEHYVKRLVGLPSERLSIDPPRLLVNGQPVSRPPSLRRITECRPGYCGYVLTGDYLRAHSNQVSLGGQDYFACGDNQRNSLDSRYWGPVRAPYLVGPAFFIYWPLSKRWGWQTE